MADITLTNVAPKAGAKVEMYTAGETLAAYDAVYLDSTANNKAKKAAAATQAESKAVGIALNAAANGEVVAVLVSGQATCSGATQGVPYFVSDTAHVSGNDGGLCPIGDMATSEYVVYVCMGISGGIEVQRHITGAQAQ